MTAIASSVVSASTQDQPRWRRRVLTIIRQPSSIVALLILLLVVAWSVVPAVFTWHDPYAPDTAAALTGPSWDHLFGTDRLGRDIFARTVHGSVTTLSSTLLAVVIAFVIGTVLGLAAGYLRGWFDLVAMRVIDTLLSIPSLLVTLVVVSALGYATINVALAVGVSSIASFARVTRSEVLRVSSQDYIESAQSLGVKRWRLVRKHVLPNAIDPVIALVPLRLGSAVLSISALGFLGFGAPPPQPEWGLLVAEGRDLLAVAPWASLFPGLVIAAVVLSANRLGKAIESTREVL